MHAHLPLIARPASHRRVWVAVLMLLFPLSGCKLVDQTSFGGAPRKPAPAELATALASHGGEPLLVIHPDDGVSYEADLRRAIAAAEARGTPKFRLVSVVPQAADVAGDAASLAANDGLARQVLDDMGDNGVTPDRVALTARTEPHLPQRELRLYQD